MVGTHAGGFAPRCARRLAKHGYEHASLDAIGAAAAVTKGSVHHHYRDKRGLFRAVFEDVERQMVEHIERVAVGSPTYFEGVPRGCEAALRRVLEGLRISVSRR